MLPSAVPLAVSKALFTAVLDSVRVEPLVVADRQEKMLCILALFNKVDSAIGKLFPIVPAKVTLSNALQL